MADPYQVEVVAADHVVWSGQSSQVVARTVNGDLGILPGHEPVLAILVPGAVEIVTTDGSREVVAVDGGFISAAQGRISILSEYAELAQEVSLSDAQRAYAQAQADIAGGDDSDDAQQRLQRAQAQVRAAQKVA